MGSRSGQGSVKGAVQCQEDAPLPQGGYAGMLYSGARGELRLNRRGVKGGVSGVVVKAVTGG